MSSTDIGAGARWSAEIAEALSSASIGIICVTPENQREPWLLFEAGALAKTLKDTFVCPYLINMRPSDLTPGPLTQFQSKVANKAGTFELVSTVNRALGSSGLPMERLYRTFERSWPDLEAKLNSLPPSHVSVQRSAEEMITEVLETVRSLARRMPEELTSIRSAHELLTYKKLLDFFPFLSSNRRQEIRTLLRELTDEEFSAFRLSFELLQKGREPTSAALKRVLTLVGLDVPGTELPEAVPPTDAAQARSIIKET
jgi:hypothetical protein